MTEASGISITLSTLVGSACVIDLADAVRQKKQVRTPGYECVESPVHWPVYVGSPGFTGGGPASQPVGLSEAHSASTPHGLVHMRSPVARLSMQRVSLPQSPSLRQGSQICPVPTQAPNLCKQNVALVPSESVVVAHDKKWPCTPPQSDATAHDLVQ